MSDGQRLIKFGIHKAELTMKKIFAWLSSNRTIINFAKHLDLFEDYIQLLESKHESMVAISICVCVFHDEWYSQTNYLGKQNQFREYLVVQYRLFILLSDDFGPS